MKRREFLRSALVGAVGLLPGTGLLASNRIVPESAAPAVESLMPIGSTVTNFHESDNLSLQALIKDIRAALQLLEDGYTKSGIPFNDEFKLGIEKRLKVLKARTGQ